MATMTNAIESDRIADHFVVVHPLDDVPEAKVDTENLGPMRMTLAVRLSLLSLRAYLALMMLLSSITCWTWPVYSAIARRTLGKSPRADAPRPGVLNRRRRES